MVREKQKHSFKNNYLATFDFFNELEQATNVYEYDTGDNSSFIAFVSKSKLEDDYLYISVYINGSFIASSNDYSGSKADAVKRFIEEEIL